MKERMQKKDAEMRSPRMEMHGRYSRERYQKNFNPLNKIRQCNFKIFFLKKQVFFDEKLKISKKKY